MLPCSGACDSCCFQQGWAAGSTAQHSLLLLLLLLLRMCPGERGAAFAALADMASSLAAVGCQEGFEGYLGAIAAQV
jgi:hypothetical protein